MRHHLRSTARGHGPILSTRGFGTSRPRYNYAATLNNLRIGSKTRVIFQGFTGLQATVNAKESIEWGTNIVGGMVPGRESEHLGLPVLPTMRRAMAELKPDATAIYVPASGAAHAIEDAILAEVPLIVAVAEHVPLHDMLRVHSILKTQTKSRLVGPNSPGIISTAEGERCRIGFQPLSCFSPGCVGIVARSGTLSYETAYSTTRAGLGQSLCIGVGGDILPGTDMVEALQVLVADPNTKAIALVGEIGGDGEILAAQWVQEYYDRTPVELRKPVAAVIAGTQAPMDRVMGHAGAFWVPGEPHPNQKIAALKAAGVTLVPNPAHFGNALRRRLQNPTAQANEIEDGASYESVDDFASAANKEFRSTQRRGFQTSTRGPGLASSRPRIPTSSATAPPQQTRSLHLDRAASQKLLEKEDMTSELIFTRYPIRYLSFGVDRATRSLCIVTAVIFGQNLWRAPGSFDKIILPPQAMDGLLSLTNNETRNLVNRLLEHLQIMEKGMVDYKAALLRVLRNLSRVFTEKEATHVSVQFSVNRLGLAFTVHDMRIELDDAAYRSGGRLGDLHEAYGAREARDPGAREAEREGIVYHRLSPRDRNCNIGTLVNGAGLAMHTVDALAGAGGKAANFLDTGGKATAETVKKAFEVILQDDRVKVVLVNIFGGLTRGDVIARGIVLAYEELKIKVPVVVRIKGSGERTARRIMTRSGLPLHAVEGFDQASSWAVDLAKGGKPPVPEAFPEGEAVVAELKDAIKLEAEAVMENGGFEAAGAEAIGAEAASLEAASAEGTSQSPVEEASEPKAEPAEDGTAQPQAAEQQPQQSTEKTEDKPAETVSEEASAEEARPVGEAKSGEQEAEKPQEPENVDGTRKSESSGSDQAA